MKKAKVYLALLHYPMRNKRMDTITTSVTNLDLHDIARAARTYDVKGFWVVHPSLNQHELIEQILAYWQEGYGGTYNPDRREAFSRLRVSYTLEEAQKAIADETGLPVITVATDASPYTSIIRYKDLRSRLEEDEAAYLVLFGTGWGMQEETLASCDLVLEPIQAGSDYNHLSVRSAVSIILDRLLGEDWFS